jgi:hypothetical protein
MRILAILAATLSMLGCQTTAPVSSEVPLMGMSKKQVVSRFGLPASISRLPAHAQGGGGFETWLYYHRSAPGGIELKHVTFGNSMSTLGQVVGYSPEILPSRIISPDTPEGFREITQYDAKHGM